MGNGRDNNTWSVRFQIILYVVTNLKGSINPIQAIYSFSWMHAHLLRIQCVLSDPTTLYHDVIADCFEEQRFHASENGNPRQRDSYTVKPRDLKRTANKEEKGRAEKRKCQKT